MCPSFKAPALDDSLILSQWLQYNSRHSPEHPLFVYASSNAELNTITWSKAAQGFERAARLVTGTFSTTNSGHGGDKLPPVVGILANLDSVTYHTLYLGIIQAGGTAFLISTRNSPDAVSHLLKKTGTHILFVSTDQLVQKLASSALASVMEDGYQVEMLSVPTFQDLFSEEMKSENTDPLLNYPRNHVDSPALILHTSGSTAFPKPIPISHRILLQWARNTKISGVDLSKHRLAAHALPVFHGMGFFMAPWAACTGLTLTVFPPYVPPVVPSPRNVLESAVASQSTFLFCVPLFIELWSRDTEDVAKLKQFDGIIFGGGPLGKSIGDALSQAGVSLLGLYGATEIGAATLMVSEPTEWDWLHVSPDMEVTFLPQEGDSDIFEIVYMVSPAHSPAIINSQVEGRGAFATNDLVVMHPNDPAKFKIHGRKDDQIVLSTGEKTNPGPIEVIICRNPLVEAAVMFGRGRDQNGIIIRPAKEHEIDPRDEKALAQFRNNVWPSVEQANAFAPSHSKIYKEMILVTHPSKPFEMTAKLAPRRPVVLQAYKDEIEGAYDAVRDSSQTGVTPPAVWMWDEVHDFFRKIVHKVMGKELADSDDIFLHGGDSLQATYIRNALIHAVRETRKEFAERIPQGFVYSNPSIAGLATQLMDIVEVRSGARRDEDSPKLKELASMIAEFSVDFPEHRPSVAQRLSSGEVVLLTGSTGGLGSQILAYLAALPNISQVYALNRQSRDGHRSLRDRQASALTERALDVRVIDSPKVTLIQGDTSVSDFGIHSTLFDEIRDNITLIIHSAWSVNFNLALESFKPMIRGVRNLVDLALRSPKKDPPRIIFAGSVSVFRNWNTPGRPLEVPIDDPRLVVGSGYSESKWVGERILEQAAKATPLRPIIVRIGQLTSNSSGAWKSEDWVPAIVRSGQVLGVLPARDDFVAWISLETAAQCIVEFRTSNSRYLHLVHPNPVPWSTVFDAFSSLLDIPLVSWNEWLSKLENDDGSPERNPALHLLEFFRRCLPTSSENREAPGVPFLDLKQALKFSRGLADPSLPPVVQKDADRWVGYWIRKGFLAS